MAKRYEVSYSRAWLFMYKVIKTLKKIEWHPITATIIIDEFAFGGKENLKQGRSTDSLKNKIVATVELIEDVGIKQVYLQTIEDH
jgi:hypothetical protein